MVQYIQSCPLHQQRSLLIEIVHALIEKTLGGEVKYYGSIDLIDARCSRCSGELAR